MRLSDDGLLKNRTLLECQLVHVHANAVVGEDGHLRMRYLSLEASEQFLPPRATQFVHVLLSPLGNARLKII